MIDKKFTTRLFQSIIRRSRGLSEHTLIHPERDWFIGLSIAFIGLIAGVVISVKLYYTFTNTTPNEGSPEVDNNQIYRASEVERALEELTRRKEQNELARENLTTQPTMPAFVLVNPTTTEPIATTSDSMPSMETIQTTPPEPAPDIITTPLPAQMQ